MSLFVIFKICPFSNIKFLNILYSLCHTTDLENLSLLFENLSFLVNISPYSSTNPYTLGSIIPLSTSGGSAPLDSRPTHAVTNDSFILWLNNTPVCMCMLGVEYLACFHSLLLSIVL